MTERNAPVMDLRGLEPPKPMMAILNHVAQPQAMAFEVLLPHYPIFLIDPLDERGWRCVVVTDEPGCCHCRLIPPGGR